jgi:hypothetical protein
MRSRGAKRSELQSLRSDPLASTLVMAEHIVRRG